MSPYLSPKNLKIIFLKQEMKMATFSQQFKVQSVDKALNRSADRTIKDKSLPLQLDS